MNVPIECECDVPEFLTHLKPAEDGKVEFSDDTNEGGEGEEGAATGGFGGNAKGVVVGGGA